MHHGTGTGSLLANEKAHTDQGVCTSFFVQIQNRDQSVIFFESDTPEYYSQWITFKEIRNHIDEITCVRKLFDMFSVCFLDSTAIENHLVPIISTFTPSVHSQLLLPNLGENYFLWSINFLSL